MARKLTVEKKFPKEGVIFYKEGFIKFLDVKCSYPHFDKPQKFTRDDGGEVEKYGMEGLIESERFQESKKYLVEKIKQIMEDRDCKCSKDKWFVIEGDEDLRPELAGMYQIKASESRKPTFLSVDGDEIDSAKELRDLFYPGVRCDMLIRPWGQNYRDQKKGTSAKRVNAGLVTVKWRRDDTRLGEEPIDTNDAWDDEEDDEYFEKQSPSKGSRQSSSNNDDDEDAL